MELDDLKLKWKSTTNLNNKSMEQLKSILEAKASGTLTSLRRKYEQTVSYVLVATMGTVILSGFMPWILGKEGTVYVLPTTLDRALNALVMVMIGLTIVYFYWRKYTTQQTVLSGDDLQESLSESILYLKRSLRQEIIFVVGLTAGWFTVARGHSQFAGYGQFWDIWRTDVLLAVMLLISMGAVYLLYRIREYNKYITEFKGYLSEYEEARAN